MRRHAYSHAAHVGIAHAHMHVHIRHLSMRVVAGIHHAALHKGRLLRGRPLLGPDARPKSGHVLLLLLVVVVLKMVRLIGLLLVAATIYLALLLVNIAIAAIWHIITGEITEIARWISLVGHVKPVLWNMRIGQVGKVLFLDGIGILHRGRHTAFHGIL